MENKRKNIIFGILLFLLVLPLGSAAIIINSQPSEIYNLGSIITVPVTIKATGAITGNFQMDLVCGANYINFYKNGVVLASGEEKNIEASLVLSKGIIEDSLGNCSIKASLGSDYALTNSFKISDSITVDGSLAKTTFNPGDNILIKGTAVREDNAPVNGFVEIDIVSGSDILASQSGIVNNGAFSINTSLPADIAAGDYTATVKAYEKDSGNDITNNGFLDQKIAVNQVPTNLEIVFENETVNPGTTLRVKAILHDQTGVKMDSLVFLTVKNSNDKILDQVELSTDEFLEFPIAYDTSPATWKVFAVSNKLNSEKTFQIPENQNVTIEITNKTVLITNTGNVPYNKTVLVDIGNESLNIDVYLKVDQSQRWLLSAPDGDYPVHVIAGGISADANVALTGSDINIKRAVSGLSSSSTAAVWIFVILILGFVAFIVFKRGYQRSFTGYIESRMQKKDHGKMVVALAIPPGQHNSRAELALSIKGDKHDVSMITLKVKNRALVKMSQEEGGAEEAIKKAIGIAEDHKAAIYDNGETIFCIFSALRTKTFSNEMTALKTAETMTDILAGHNKVFKQKIDFGISLTDGSMVAKQESNSFKFMPMGNIMTQAKKIAAVAEDEILMDVKTRDKLGGSVRSEKHKKDGIEVYSVKEIKNREQHEKFLKGFMKRMEKDRKE